MLVPLSVAFSRSYPSFPAPSAKAINPIFDALGNTGLADNTASFELNPTHVNKIGHDFELPYVASSTVDTYHMMRALLYRDWTGLASSLPAGLSDSLRHEAGLGFRINHFGMNLRATLGALSSSDPKSQGGVFSSYLQAYVLGALRFATGGTLYLKDQNNKLDFAFGSGLDAISHTGDVNAVTLTSAGYNAFYEAPVYTAFNVPFSFGITYGYRNSFAVSTVVRSDKLLSFGVNSYKDIDSTVNIISTDFLSFLGNGVYFNYETIDVDFGIKYAYEKSRKWSIKFLSDVNGIVSLCMNPNDWISYLGAGIEYKRNGIALRAGFNQGPTAGIGLDFDYVHFDTALRYVMFPNENCATGTFVTAKFKIGN